MAYGVTISSVILVVLIFSGLRRNLLEFLVGLLVPSLAMPLNGFLTNSIKLTVGRPRPDYFDRCYPGVKNFNSSLPCTGDMEDVIEGRKSFPSGHSSIFFTAFTFVSLYLAGQLGVFNKRGRSQAWKLMLVLLPLVLALFAAISRTADYHHHWQDVTVGGILGATISLFVYHQYFPRVTSDVAHLSIFSHDEGNVLHSVQDAYKPSTSASLRRNNTSTSSFGYNDPVKSV